MLRWEDETKKIPNFKALLARKRKLINNLRPTDPDENSFGVPVSLPPKACFLLRNKSMATTSANLITIDELFSGEPVPVNKVWAEKVTCSIREQLQLRWLLVGWLCSQ